MYEGNSGAETDYSAVVVTHTIASSMAGNLVLVATKTDPLPLSLFGASASVIKATWLWLIASSTAKRYHQRQELVRVKDRQQLRQKSDCHNQAGE